MLVLLREVGEAVRVWHELLRLSGCLTLRKHVPRAHRLTRSLRLATGSRKQTEAEVADALHHVSYTIPV